MDLILQYIVPAILGIGVVSAVVKWLVGLLNEVKEALGVVTDALSDGLVDNTEIQAIVKESKDIIVAAKKIKEVFKK